jgi:hypothetical protein
MTQEYQVNRHYSYRSDEETFSISEKVKGGYCGRLTSTVYMNGGCDYDEFKEFVGTREECEKYVKDNDFTLCSYR